jgi:hypothetical protein
VAAVAKQQHLTVREIAELIRRPHEEMTTVVDRIRGWADYGLLKVSGDKHPGTGKKRLYGAGAIVDSVLLTALTDLGLAAVRVGHFSSNNKNIIQLCRQAALTVLGNSDQRDVDWMLILGPPLPGGRSSASFSYEVAERSNDGSLSVPVPSSLEGAIVLNLTKIFKPLRSALEVVHPEPPGFPFFRLKENAE